MDVTGARFPHAALEEAKQATVLDLPYVKRAAVVGARTDRANSTANQRRQDVCRNAVAADRSVPRRFGVAVGWDRQAAVWERRLEKRRE